MLLLPAHWLRLQMNSGTLNNVFTGLLCASALVIAGILVRREFVHAEPKATEASTQVSNWRDFAHGQALEPSGNPVTLIIFSDYQCPFCRTLAARLDTVRIKFPHQLSIYYRNTPIPSHRFARAAAYAAECAGRVGLFPNAHRALFEESDSLGIQSWGRFASRIGMRDTTAFAVCVRDSLPLTVVQQDEIDAKRLGIHSTPSFLVNDEFVRGAPSLDQLSALIERHGKPTPGAR